MIRKKKVQEISAISVQILSGTVVCSLNSLIIYLIQITLTIYLNVTAKP